MPTYQRTRKRTVQIKVEGTPGTYETTAAADAIQLEEVQTPLNPVEEQTNEARDTLSASQRLIKRLEPSLTGTFLLRGSGAVGTAPRVGPALRACGLAETIAAVLPSSGEFTATAGTTTTATFLGTGSPGSQLPSTAGALVGRWVTLAGNPATPVVAAIVNYTISGNDRIVTFDRTFGSALSTSTTMVVMPCIVYKPTDGTPAAVSWDKFVDGRRIRCAGGRGTGGFTFEGNGLPRLTNLDIKGQFISEADASPSGVDFSSLPAPPQWSDGVCLLNRVVRACASMDFAIGATVTRYPNPNLPGPDLAILTGRDTTGTFTTNSELVAVDPAVTQIDANTLVPFSAAWDLTLAAGRRMGLVIPALGRLNRTEQDREGVAEDSFSFQANPLYGADEFILSMCL